MKKIRKLFCTRFKTVLSFGKKKTLFLHFWGSRVCMGVPWKDAKIVLLAVVTKLQGQLVSGPSSATDREKKSDYKKKWILTYLFWLSYARHKIWKEMLYTFPFKNKQYRKCFLPPGQLYVLDIVPYLSDCSLDYTLTNHFYPNNLIHQLIL